MARRRDTSDAPRRPGLLARARGNFLAGLIVVAPIGMTVWLIWTLIGWVDGFVLPLVPRQFRPEQYIGINLRGVGVIFFLLFTIVIGWMAKGFVGRQLLRAGENVVDRMPFVRSIYGGAKQIAETVFADSANNFDRAVLIEYPRRGAWAIAFVSTPAKGEIAKRHVEGGGEADPLLSIFVPTTPNPTSGFLLFLPASDVVELDMSVEDAAKLVISAGLVYPNGKDELPEPTLEAAE
ncbi:MAG: DUF502 domain-containing protein [Hasllibacter sp.]